MLNRNDKRWVRCVDVWREGEEGLDFLCTIAYYNI
jgi:hypothetical protein